VYYVYTLAYPDGTVFYVGKGTGRRMYQHEGDAFSAFPVNPGKAAVIRDIIDSGQEVLKTAVAEFESELDAYILEWGITIQDNHGKSGDHTSQCHRSHSGQEDHGVARGVWPFSSTETAKVISLLT
jgi:hypothetical protein